MTKINFGIIGTGRIAGQFATEASANPRIKLLGVCARNYEKTRSFARDHSIENAYSSVDELLNNKEIDAVYVASFHPTHFPYTIKALAAGKHVLCEKPAVLNREQMERVVESAGKNNLLFMEAMTVGFNPVYQQLKKDITDGVIGDILHLESSYGRVSSKIHKHNPTQAGGALYDIGIYNIFLMTDILGVPMEISAVSRANKWGVEGSVTCMGKHKNNATSSFYATMDSISGESAKIIGSKGVIKIPASWTVAKEYILETSEGERKNYQVDTDVWLGYEIESFISTLIGGKKENPIMTYESSLNLHTAMDSIKAELGFVYDDIDTTTY